jgi:preprotein translocase subunit Sec63
MLKHTQSTSQVDLIVHAPEIVAEIPTEMVVQTCEDNLVSDSIESDSISSEFPEVERFRCCVM